MKILENILLKNHTTFKIGGPARFFCEVDNKQDLKKLIKKYPEYYILGVGSNILVSDKGFNGLIIKIENCKLKIVNCYVYAEAGASLGQVVAESVKYGLTGLEWAIGIPGTIGGAVAVNASAFGSCMNDLLEKTEKINNIIWSVNLKLKKLKNKNNLIQEYLNYRKKTQPQGHACAGCIFKNPKNQSAGYLIDKAGLKGVRIGGAEISKKHANFILNKNNASAQDVLDLIKLIRKKVKIKLELEIKLLGFKPLTSYPQVL